MKTVFAAALAVGAAGLASVAAAAWAEPPAAVGAPGRFDPDTNHDGYLSRAEALAMADARFERLDKNKDGKLTSDELALHGPRGPWRGAPGQGAAAPEARPPGAPPPAAQPDRPHSGPGMRHARFRHEMMERHDLANLLTEYDRNHDGAIELSEFRARAEARFVALDGNHDGKVKLPEHKRHDGEHRWGPPGDGAPPPSPLSPKP